MRAFLAVPVLAPALAPLAALRERLVAEVGEVRWAPAASPHITLHFFGSLSDAAAARALEAVGPALTGQTPIPLRLQGLGAFPSRGVPRVLWCGVDGDLDALRALAQRCRDALRAAGCAVDDRRWRPHCTIGRPRQPWPAPSRRRWSELAGADHPMPRFTVDRAILYESASDHGAVTHIPRATVPFAAPAPARAAR
ncbi:MAG: RNA 2',3'-cyclic phosphodiesterase [Candidatus Dormibacteria bacterium]